MSTRTKYLSTMAVLILLLAVSVNPAYAFEDRTGDYVSIETDEVIDDDLYAAAQVFTLDGEVTGDLVVVAQTITINGKVGGDLIAAGQTVIVNGEVADDVRIAGAGLQLGPQAVIGDDLVAAGASLETKQDSTISGELVVAGGQAVLGGNVAGDLLAGTGGLELNGEFGGDVAAYVGETDDNAPPLGMYMSNSPITLPSVQPGLKISDQASITGNLMYTSATEISIPAGVVNGMTTRTEPKFESAGSDATLESVPEKDPLVKWSLDLLRNFVTLLLFGSLIVWLTPNFLSSITHNIRTKFGPSLGWGLVAYAAFYFALLLVLVTTIIGGMIFGFLTLGSVSATIIFVGLFLIFALVLGFILIASFFTKISVGHTLGKWILSLTKADLAENKYWAMILGVLVIALAISLPLIGWLFGLIVLVIGLGGIWLWGRALMKPQPIRS